MKILITGGTGFIGKRVVKELASHVESIYLLVRPVSLRKAKKQFADLTNIQLILGDILENNIILNKEDEVLIQSNIDSILHLAGYYDLKINQLTAYTYNVIGLQNVIALAKKCNKLQYFHHISTYSVTGNVKGLHTENFIANPRNFTDHYSRSKMQGENIFRNVHLPNVKKRIYRPGIVVGSTHDGEIEKIDGPYYLLKFINDNKEKLKILNAIKYLPFPYDKQTILPLIPVDVLANWLVEAVTHPTDHEEIRSYHFVSNNKIYIEEVIEMLFNLNNLRPQIIKLGKVPLLENMLPLIGIPKQLMTYMFQGSDFDTKNRHNDFPKLLDYELKDLAQNFMSGAAKFFQSRPI